MNPLKSIRDAWKKWPTSARVSVSAATFFAATSAFTDARTLFKDVFASPEKQLTELGYHQRTYDEFLRAIANRDVEAVELFTKIGKRLKPEHFSELFDDRVYHSGVVEALIVGKSITSEHCPTGGRQVGVYAKHSSNTEKAKLLREACAHDAVINSLRASLQAEELRLGTNVEKNAERGATLQACQARYLKEGEQQMIEAASRFSIVSRETYSERECVLAKLNVALLAGDPELRSGPQAFRSYVAECCSTYNAEVKLDTTILDNMKSAIGLLSTR